MKYLLSLPGKEPRELENVIYEKIIDKVTAMGGTLTLIPDTKPEPPKEVPTQNFYTKEITAPLPNTKQYSVQEAHEIFVAIRQKYFPNTPQIQNVTMRINWRLRNRRVGTANYRTKTLELNKMLLGEKSNWLHQVIYHELCHFEFPGQGHRGIDFRAKEMCNPFRSKWTRRLTQVS